MNRRNVLILLAGVVIVGLMWLPTRPTAEARTHAIDLTASQYAFAPGRVVVNRGDRVIVTLASSDVVHGFYLDDYGIQARVTPGVSQSIEFTADHSGKFRFRCSVNCGALHPFMIGELVVQPNNFFWKSLGTMLIGVAGLLLYLWNGAA